MKKRNLVIYLILQIVAVALFIAADFNQFYLLANITKYLIVVFNAFYYFRHKEKNIQNAQLIILVADALLLFSNYYLLGIMAFMVVQIFYCRYLNNAYYFYYLFIIPVFTGITTYVVSDYNVLSAMAITYLFMLIINIFLCIAKRDYIMMLGLILLLLCDICIGLNNIGLDPIYIKLVWLFYWPSQLIINLLGIAKQSNPTPD